MVHRNLKKILAGYSLTVLLTAAFSTNGCSKPEEQVAKPVDQKISEQPSFPGEKDREITEQQKAIENQPFQKQTGQLGKEIKIRGKSG